jgi:hypothetical protein
MMRLGVSPSSSRVAPQCSEEASGEENMRPFGKDHNFSEAKGPPDYSTLKLAARFDKKQYTPIIRRPCVKRERRR